MRLLPKSIHWCRRYPTKFNSGRDIPGISVESTNAVLKQGTVEALDLAMSFGIGGGSVNQPNPKSRDDLQGVGGDESGSVVEVEGAHQAVFENGLVKPSQEELGVLRGADDGVESEAASIVEEVQGDALATIDSGAKVLSVGEHHEHAVGIGEATFVVAGLFAARGRKLHAATGSPNTDARDGFIFRDNAFALRASEQLGNRGEGVSLFFDADELDKLGGRTAESAIFCRGSFSSASIPPAR